MLDRCILHREISVALPRGDAAARVATRSGLPRLQQGIPGSRVSPGTADPEAALTGLALELKQLAEANKIPFAADFSAPLPRPRYGPSAPESSGMPQRFAHLGIPVRWPSTPAEFVAYGDLQNLIALLELYAQGSTSVEAASTASTQVAPGIQPPRHVSRNFTGRSEEHTSELQSQSNLVCRLLLEKKKKKKKKCRLHNVYNNMYRDV